MNILYLELVGGISGDMTVAALLELGVPLELLRDGLARVGLNEVSLATEPGSRHQIAGTRFLVTHRGGLAPDGAASAPAEAPAGHAHSHDAPHTHFHGAHTHDISHDRGAHPGPPHPHSHPHSHDSGAAHPAGSGHAHRPYREIRALLEGADLPAGARERALAVFARLAEAEGRVHGLPPEEVTFHEVGAWDSIADVVCVALALEHLRPEAVYCSSVPVGAGLVTTAHGRMPVPAPATLLLLEGFPIVQGGPAFERTTPTGAAILAALATPAPEPFAFVPRRVGIGLGRHDPPEVPNLLRAVLGEVRAAAPAERIECAEANLDDSNPEWIGYLMERLLAAGALDVTLIPVHMKKNRPGTLIQVLYPPPLRERMLDGLFSETTTLGVRFRELERVVLARERVAVSTPWGPVTGMVATHQGHRRFSPEYESCREAAQREAVPLREVYLAAQQAWRAGEEERR